MSRRRRRRGRPPASPQPAGLESPLKREKWFNIQVLFAFALGMFVVLILFSAITQVPWLWFALYAVSTIVVGWGLGRVFVRGLWLQRQQQRSERQSQAEHRPPPPRGSQKAERP